MRPLCPLGMLAVITAAISILPGATLEAQETPPGPIVAPSGRVVTSVSFDGRLMGGNTWLKRSTSHSGPARMTIDYGQPHARGRTIFGGLVPYGRVWRLGANLATHLTVELNVRIGDLDIPRGTYTLYMLPHEDGADLIVSRQTRQWGTEHDATQDLGRVPLRRRALSDTAESLTIAVAPVFPQPVGELPEGTLRIAWGEAAFTTVWHVLWP